MSTSVQKKTARWGIGLSLGSLIGLINPELTRHILNDAWQSTLAQAFIVITVVWFTMGRKVAKGVKQFQVDTLAVMQESFTEVKNAVDNVAVGLHKLEETMRDELSSHSELIGNVTLDVAKLNVRVDHLEKPTGQGGGNVRG